VTKGRSGGHIPHKPEKVEVTKGKKMHGRHPAMRHDDAGVLQNRGIQRPHQPDKGHRG
jgi:hypothetical protein